MKVQTASVAFLAMGPLVSLATGTAQPTGAHSASLFAASELEPSASNIFLNDPTSIGFIPASMLSRSSPEIVRTGRSIFHPFAADDCEHGAAEDDLVLFSGGGADLLFGSSTNLNTSPSSTGVSLGHFSGANHGSAPTPGGSGGGGASGGGGEGGGGGGAGGSTNDGGPSTSAQSGSPSTNGASNPPSTSGSISDWAPLPLPDVSNTLSDGGSIGEEGHSGASPLPLPAPVWMGLAGLTLLVLLRRRLLP